ncbi:MAG: galactokinase [Alyxoria varia]|nr:MAG: galactokinase [Alyxoria varia]
MSGVVPTTSSFSEVYPQDAIPAQEKRWGNLLSHFEKEYGRKAEYVSRSPGRVNIIGEHIDYSLYECLPMAITADVCLAFCLSPSNNKIRIANTNPAKFPTGEFDIPSEKEIPIDAEAHDWSNYFKSGLRGAAELLQKKKKTDARSAAYYQPVGMDIVVDGTVPAGGGLSSSAAFVCASALAVMKANGEDRVDKRELVEVAIVSERAVGVNSGGMDQSASVFSLKDSGLCISFVPKLSAQPVTFPTAAPDGNKDRELVFLIAQSFVTSNKRVTGPIHYNLRVVECTLAAHYLARILRLTTPLPSDAGPLGSSLRGLHDTYFSEKENTGPGNRVDGSTYAAQLEKLSQLVEDYLVQDEGYTREDIAKTLGISVDELNSKYTTKVPVRAERFKLRQRALHVFTEALRVQRVMALLQDDAQQQQTAGTENTRAADLGMLVTETQNSLRESYECSCPELDQLCEIALKNGAWGGRVTGAGWGGCSVHLVPAESVERMKDAWRREYFAVKFPEMGEEELAEAIVATKPGNGSLVYETKGWGGD